MDGQDQESAKGRLLGSSRRLLIALVAVVFVAAFVAFLAALAYEVGALVFASGASWRDAQWSTLIGAAVLFGVVCQLAWIWGKDALGFAIESAGPVVEHAREVAQESSARRDDERGREALQDAQGGALSVSGDDGGGRLSELESAEGGLGISSEYEEVRRGRF